MKRIPLYVLSIALLFSLCSCTGRKISVSEKIKQAFTEDTLEIKMTDFTDFSWDTLIIYRNPADIEQINKAGHIDYQGSLDLTDGMIFVNDGQVIYEETFPTDFETPHEFVIFPYMEGYHNPEKVNVFTPKTAIFSGTKETYEDKYDYYIFYPMKMQNE